MAGLQKYVRDPPDNSLPPHVIAPLLGRFKNKVGTWYHLTPLAATTSSGILVQQWVSHLVSSQEQHYFFRGPAFCDALGLPATSRDNEMDILDRLQAVRSREPSLIPADILVHEAYGISPSFRRGTTSEARACGVSPENIGLINRWHAFEHAKGC